MAKVIQVVATDKNHQCYDSKIVDDAYWHASYSVDDIRTICGMQLAGEDGIAPGPTREGTVTCPTCRKILSEIQSIKNWR